MSNPINSSSTLENGVATLITSYLMRVLKFEYIHYGIVFTLILKAVDLIKEVSSYSLSFSSSSSNSNIDNLAFSSTILSMFSYLRDFYTNFNNIYFVIICFLLLFLFLFSYLRLRLSNHNHNSNTSYSLRSVLNFLLFKKYLTIEVYNKDKIALLVKYLESIPDVTNKDSHYLYGDMNTFGSLNDGSSSNTISSNENYVNMKEGTISQIHDKELNLSGYVKWTSHTSFTNISEKSSDGESKSSDSFSDKNSKKSKKSEDNIMMSTHCYPTIYLDINCNVGNAATFFDKLTSRLNNLNNLNQENTGPIKLYHYKIMLVKENNVENFDEVLYSGKRRTLEEREKLYIEPFFYEGRDRLWNLIKTIHYNPQMIEEKGQCPRLNLLLHGPPGTGKSSFAYRMAMALERHMITLDLRDVPTKSNMLQIIRKPCIQGQHLEPRNIVLILDEFDLALDYLYKKENILKKKGEQSVKEIDYNHKLMDAIMRSVDNLTKHFDKEVINKDKGQKSRKGRKGRKGQDIKGQKDQSKKDGISKEKKNKIPKNIDDNDSSNGSENIVDSDKELEDKSEDESEDSSDLDNLLEEESEDESIETKLEMTKKFERFTKNKPFLMLHDIKSSTKHGDLLGERNAFVLKDLLEVFQGPIPKEGSLIMATTNNFDKIYEICPPLFRAGRLTPVHFGYATYDTINDISKFYFKQELTIMVPSDHKIPTSEIIELALESDNMVNLKNLTAKHAYFQERLNKML